MRSVVRDRTRDWWLLVVRGLVAVVFGLGAFFWPGLTIAALAILFGAYALVDGLAEIYRVVRNRSGEWGWHLLEGIIGVAAGLVALVAPAAAALALVVVIGAWAILTGIAEIVVAIRLRDRLQGEWLWVIAGIASIVFGAVLVASPAAGALALVWLIGSYAVVFGIVLVALGVAMRQGGRISARAA